MPDTPDDPPPDSPSPPGGRAEESHAEESHVVEISDEQTVLEVPHGLLVETVRRVLSAERVASARIGLALVDDAAIAVLNRRWLDHEGPTDVLSFVLESERVQGREADERLVGRAVPDERAEGRGVEVRASRIVGRAVPDERSEGRGSRVEGRGPESDGEAEAIERGSCAESVPRGAGLRIDGDVVVSTQTALRQAAEFSWSPLDELLLYVVHGVLHLLGYDDLSSEERDLMRTRERDLLRAARPDLVDIPGRPLATDGPPPTGSGPASGGAP